VKRLVPVRLVLVLCLALVAVPVADAKLRVTLRLSDPTPTAGQAVRATVRVPEQFADVRQLELRLVAVPPGTGLYAALRAERRHRVALVRHGATWTGRVRFTRPGRWRLVVPNVGAPGYAIPPPVVQVVRVR
jgi:hypothetical protein